MKTRRQKLLEDRRAIARRNSRSSASVKGGINADLIPIDLIIEIFSRLAVKSIARCRCVSKLWSSILVRADFTELVLARSAGRPKFLFVCNESLIFSSPQPQNPNENSSPIVANYHMNFQFDNLPCIVYPPVHGLLCFKTRRIFQERKFTVLVICNPSTGQSLTLPRVKTKRVEVKSFFGYEPIDKQFKLLSMTRPRSGKNKVDCGEHQVMTLGTGKLLWRMIECSTPHYTLSEGICINGVLYYRASVNGNDMIACFDIRSEKFKFTEEAKLVRGELVNYKGKLATLKTDNWPEAISKRSRSFELCVLQDAEKHEWTTHTYVLPPLWKDIVADFWLYIIGVTRTGEIVLSPYYSPYYPTDLTYFIYYNLERDTIIKVEIQGIYQSEHQQVNVFLDHVEDVKLGGVFPTS